MCHSIVPPFGGKSEDCITMRRFPFLYPNTSPGENGGIVARSSKHFFGGKSEICTSTRRFLSFPPIPGLGKLERASCSPKSHQLKARRYDVQILDTLAWTGIVIRSSTLHLWEARNSVFRLIIPSPGLESACHKSTKTRLPDFWNPRP